MQRNKEGNDACKGGNKNPFVNSQGIQNRIEVGGAVVVNVDCLNGYGVDFYPLFYRENQHIHFVFVAVSAYAYHPFNMLGGKTSQSCLIVA